MAKDGERLQFLLATEEVRRLTEEGQSWTETGPVRFASSLIAMATAVVAGGLLFAVLPQVSFGVLVPIYALLILFVAVVGLSGVRASLRSSETHRLTLREVRLVGRRAPSEIELDE